MPEPASNLPQRLRGRTAPPDLVVQHWGRIVNIASGGARGAPVPPGLIETPAVQRMPAEVSDFALRLTPARRLDQPGEITALVAFLCAEESAFINGAEIDADDGGHLSPVVLAIVREVEARRTFRR